VKCGTGQRAEMPRGWEGVALSVRFGLSGLSTYGLIGHRKGDEHPTYAPCGVSFA